MRSNRKTDGAIRPRAILTLCLLALLPLLAWATAPAWWTTRGVLKSGATADDFAAANLGQVKALFAFDPTNLIPVAKQVSGLRLWLKADALA